MTNTYFHEDLSSWSESVAVQEAISEVRATSDLTRRNDSTRRTNDDQERRAELSLGEILFHFPGAIMDVAKATLLTTGALRERRDVYALTIEANAMDELLAMTLSYTNHRGIVGLRIKSDGTEGVTISDRIMAAHDSIERNGGIFKEDDPFFVAIGALPPANNFDRVVSNLTRSTDYADTKLDDKETYAALAKVMEDYDKRHGKRRGIWGGGTSGTLSKESQMSFSASRATAHLHAVRDFAQEIGVPIGILVETEDWEQIIRELREMSAQPEPANNS